MVILVVDCFLQIDTFPPLLGLAAVGIMYSHTEDMCDVEKGM